MPPEVSNSMWEVSQFMWGVSPPTWEASQSKMAVSHGDGLMTGAVTPHEVLLALQPVVVRPHFLCRFAGAHTNIWGIGRRVE